MVIENEEQHVVVHNKIRTSGAIHVDSRARHAAKPVPIPPGFQLFGDFDVIEAAAAREEQRIKIALFGAKESGTGLTIEDAMHFRWKHAPNAHARSIQIGA